MGFKIYTVATIAFVPAWFYFMIHMAEHGYKVDGRRLLPLILVVILSYCLNRKRQE